MSSKLLLALIVALLGGAAVFLVSGERASAPAAAPGAPDDRLQTDAPRPQALASDAAARDERAERAALIAEEAELAPAAARLPVGLRGRVLDARGAPLAGARVMLALSAGGERGGGRVPGFGRGERVSRASRRPLVTDAQGLFFVESRAFGELEVRVEVAHEHHAPLQAERQVGALAVGADGAAPLVDLGDFKLAVGATVRGRVIAAGGAGIPGATASLNATGGPRREAFARGGPPQRPQVQTDRNGFFEIAHLLPGDYRVRAVAPRYQDAGSREFALAEDQVHELGDILLEPGHLLRGKVAAADGTPIERADVRVESGGRRGGTFRARTEADGAFAIDHLPPERLQLTVTARRFLDHEQAAIDPVQTPFVAVRLFEGLTLRGLVAEADTTEPITRYAVSARRTGDLPDPERERQRAELDRQRTELRGLAEQMRSAGAQPSEQQREQIRALRDSLEQLAQEAGDGGGPFGRGGRRPDFGGSAGDREVEAHPDGRFEIEGLQEGVYVVAIEAPDREPLTSEPVELRAGAPAAERVFRLGRGFTVEGTVRGVDGAPAAGARVELLAVDAQPQRARDGGRDGGPFGEIIRRFTEQAGPRGRPVARATTDTQGRFAIANQPAGTFFVQASAAGSSRARGEPFKLAGDRAGIQLTLAAPATLRGTVRGVPAGKHGEVRVTIASGFGFGRGGGRGGDGTRIARIDEAGRYEAADLQPGSYVVRASLADRGALLRAEVGRLAQGGSFEFDVTLAAGEVREHDLALFDASLGSVTGVVLHNGAPASGMRVALRTADAANGGRAFGFGGRGGGRFGFGAEVAADGRFTIEAVTPGDYELEVRDGERGGERLHGERVTVRAAPLQVRVHVATGSLSGAVVLPADVKPEDLRGSVRLLPGVTELPADRSALRGRDGAMLRVRDGRFESERIAAGSYLLVFNAPGREPATLQVSILAGAPTRVSIPLGAVSQRAEGAAAAPPRGERQPREGGPGDAGGRGPDGGARRGRGR